MEESAYDYEYGISIEALPVAEGIDAASLAEMVLEILNCVPITHCPERTDYSDGGRADLLYL